MEDFKITIPKPCHENWDNMTANEQGKHCGVCDKTVVDFTKMEAVEIKHYFKSQESKVCGRFNENHVSPYIPKYQQWLMNLRQKIEAQLNFTPFRKLALASVGLSMFMVGCYKKSNNLMAYNHPQEMSKKDSVFSITTVGNVSVQIDTTKTSKPDSTCVKMKNEENKTIMGEKPMRPKR